MTQMAYEINGQKNFYIINNLALLASYLLVCHFRYDSLFICVCIEASSKCLIFHKNSHF